MITVKTIKTTEQKIDVSAIENVLSTKNNQRHSQAEKMFEILRQLLRENRNELLNVSEYKIITNGYGHLIRIEYDDRTMTPAELFKKLSSMDISINVIKE